MKNSLVQYAKHAFGLFALIFVLSPVLSSGENVFIDTAVAQANPTQQVIGFDNASVRAAIAIQNRHTKKLIAIPGVVGTAIGLGLDGQPVITVFTMRAGIPDIPVMLEGIPVQVEVTGMIVAFADPTARFPLPVPIGVSTGHPDITAGTIGARVTDASGNIFALSNNHVYANSNQALSFDPVTGDPGDNVLQPGPLDGGIDPDDAIGTLYSFEPIDFSGAANYIDAAIALTSRSAVDCATPSDGYGAPSTSTATATVAPPLAVQKYGRTTGWTYGEVTGLNVNLNVCYKAQGLFRCKNGWMAWFEDQIRIEAVAPTTGSFSAGGDSGSLIVTDDGNNNPVALLFAGDTSGNTYANKIQPVLARIGNVTDLTIDSCTVTAITDIAITAVNAPASVTQSDDPVEVTVDVENVGNQDVSGIIVTLEDVTDVTDIITISTRTVSGGLSARASSTETFSWNISSASLGGHTLRASHNITDDVGGNNSNSTTTVVNDPGTITIVLTATGYKVQGRQKADLDWSDATSTNVDIYRDGNLIATTENDGAYTDNINRRGGGTYVYKVCEAGTSTCSNQATVSF